MGYIQATNISRTVYLSLADVPATGIPFTDIICEIKTQTDTSFVAYPLTSPTWVELGNGLYSITFTATVTATVGDFTYTLQSTDEAFDNFLYDEFSIEPPPASQEPLLLPQQCIVSGNVASLNALPPNGEPLKIVAYTTQFPAQFATSIIVGDSVWTFADAYGNFSLALVQNAVVIIEIKRAGIRAQITVPQASSANLLDLLPAFPNNYSL
jgi:hypothetical protein